MACTGCAARRVALRRLVAAVVGRAVVPGGAARPAARTAARSATRTVPMVRLEVRR